MTIIYAAATLPVNPHGSSPTVTLDQLWAGLELKVRYDGNVPRVAPFSLPLIMSFLASTVDNRAASVY